MTPRIISKTAAGLMLLIAQVTPARADQAVTAWPPTQEADQIASINAQFQCLAIAYRSVVETELRLENKSYWQNLPDPLLEDYETSDNGKSITIRIKGGQPIPYMQLDVPEGRFKQFYKSLWASTNSYTDYKKIDDRAISLRSITVITDDKGVSLSYRGIRVDHPAELRTVGEGPYLLPEVNADSVKYTKDGKPMFDPTISWGNRLAADMSACAVRPDVQLRYKRMIQENAPKELKAG